MNKNENLFKVFYHYENVPKFMRKSMRKWFMKNRSEVVTVYNELIDSINHEWRLTGKPTMLGEYIEDINPEYSKLIQNRVQPYVDAINKHFTIYKYRIDEYGDITAHVTFIKNSKLWISLKELES